MWRRRPERRGGRARSAARAVAPRGRGRAWWSIWGREFAAQTGWLGCASKPIVDRVWLKSGAVRIVWMVLDSSRTRATHSRFQLSSSWAWASRRGGSWGVFPTRRPFTRSSAKNAYRARAGARVWASGFSKYQSRSGSSLSWSASASASRAASPAPLLVFASAMRPSQVETMAPISYRYAETARRTRSWSRSAVKSGSSSMTMFVCIRRPGTCAKLWVAMMTSSV